MINKEIYEEKESEINATTLKRMAQNLLFIMLMLVMIILFIYCVVMNGSLFGAWDVMWMGILCHPLMALMFQANGGVLLNFISMILAISSSISICNILTSNDSNKSFRKLKKKAIIMLIFDCIVLILFCIKGFPGGFNSSGNTREIGIFLEMMNFIISYFYSIFNVIYTGILCLIAKKENKNDVIEVEEDN